MKRVTRIVIARVKQTTHKRTCILRSKQMYASVTESHIVVFTSDTQ